MDTNFAPDISALLLELSSVQSDLIALIDEKRRLLLDKKVEQLGELETRERELIGRLQDCHNRRATLLEQASTAKLPCDSIRSLAAATSAASDDSLTSEVHDAAVRGRLLQHKSLSNWVLVQRWLIHLSQLLEIIATGGQLQPTYGKDAGAATSGGSLVDQAA